MLVFGIGSSCDETGVALYDTRSGLCTHALYSQIAMRREYGGVVPELTSYDHIRRMIPLLEEVPGRAGATHADIDAIAYTKGPGLAGTLLVGASVANALTFILGKPLVTMHHLEGHLLSSLLEADRLGFPLLALLVSGGHMQLMRVDAVGQYTPLGETLGDAAGETSDKTTKLFDLGYPSGSVVSRLVEFGNPGVFDLPRPMLHSGNFDFSFAGLKTAVLTQVCKLNLTDSKTCYQPRADLARMFVDAIVEVLVRKTLRAAREHGLKRIVVAGGVGANRQLRGGLNARGKKRGLCVYYPDLQFCIDNGAIIAFAGAMRLQADPAQVQDGYDYGVTSRWGFEDIRIQHA